MKILIIILSMFSFLSCTKPEFDNTAQPQPQPLNRKPYAKAIIYASHLTQREWVYSIPGLISNKKLPYYYAIVPHCDSVPFYDVVDITLFTSYRITVKRASVEGIDPFAMTTYISAQREGCLYFDVSRELF